ncbi:MAG: RnfABCDGE type electron transport complex subunit B [Ruminococcaceae bacterium]|nr:RnfABCDGE type electron transport complex subunit B [Oscillospiraceae bacterium]
MNEILFPALSIGAIALFFGALLAFASVVFSVKTDEREEKIAEILPGANCGGCGYAGCSAFAKGIVADGAQISRCNLMTDEKLSAIAEIMGVQAGKRVKKVAHVSCVGSCAVAKSKYEYYGTNDCVTASQLGGGPKECSYGCLGLGSCAEKCIYGAITVSDGVAFVDRAKCVGCGACADICPKGLIKLVEDKPCAFVNCNSADKGAVVRNVCDVGCFGCKICEKKCEFDAIHVENNLAKVDTDKCTACGVCVEACPRKIIKIK